DRMTSQTENVRCGRWRPQDHRLRGCPRRVLAEELVFRLAEIDGRELSIPSVGDQRERTPLFLGRLDFNNGIGTSIHQGCLRIDELVPQIEQAAVKRVEVDVGAPNDLLTHPNTLVTERLIEDLIAQFEEFTPDRNMLASEVTLQVPQFRHMC